MTINLFDPRGWKRGACGVAIAATLITATPLSANSPINTGDTTTSSIFEAQTGASQRISWTGKLRTLSQTVVGHACYLHAGIEPETSRALFDKTEHLFDQILTALEFGDPEMGIIGAEERPRTLAGIARLHQEWDPIMEHGEIILAGNGTAADLDEMAMHSDALLETSKRMVTLISSQYAQQNEMRQADALVIDLAGRQRTLSQQMAKAVCLINVGVDVEHSIAELQEARDNFDNTMRALYAGMPAVGIAPPPTPEIGAQLGEVLAIWEALAPTIDAVLAGEKLDDEKMALVMQGGDLMMEGMHHAVALYSENSRFDS